MDQPAALSKPKTAGARNEDCKLSTTLRRLRKQSALTLQQLGQRSGISVSTLSKIENGQLSPTFEKIAALAQGLDVDVGELFSPSPRPTPLGRKSVSLKGTGVVHETAQYAYEVLNTDLARKLFVPLVATIKAHSISEFPAMLRHDGEEFVYVLSGTVIINTEFYEPFTLEAGDACYFDSAMGHACVSGSKVDARVLWVCSNVKLP
jgi:transcriptional regulator with XRE-family HTH domain